MRQFQMTSVAMLIALFAGFSNAQELFNFDFNDYDNNQPEGTYFYGYTYAGQGSEDCTMNTDNSSESSDVLSAGTAAVQHANVTGDFSGWSVDPLACYSYAGVGVGAGYVFGFNDGAGTVTHSRKLTSNDFSQYTVSFDAWVEGIPPSDPQGSPTDLRVFLQGSELDPDGSVRNMVVLGFDDNLPNEVTPEAPLYVSDTRQTFTYTFDELIQHEFDNNNGNAPYGFPTYADYQAGAWDEFTQIQVQLQVQGNADDFEFDSNNVINIDNIVVTAPFEEISSGLTCDFDSDMDCDPEDIGFLYGNFGTAGGIYDVDGSGTVDDGDIGEWLAQASDPANPFNVDAKTFAIGDIDFDGDIDSGDLGILLNNFGSDAGLLYVGGNLNDDANVDSADLGRLLNGFGFSSVASAAAVPEPSAWSLLLLASLALAGITRRR